MCARKKCGSRLQRNFPSRCFLLTLLGALPRVGLFLHEGTVPSGGEPQSRQSGLFFFLSSSLLPPIPPTLFPSTPGGLTALHIISSVCSRHARSERKRENRVWTRSRSGFASKSLPVLPPLPPTPPSPKPPSPTLKCFLLAAALCCCGDQGCYYSDSGPLEKGGK